MSEIALTFAEKVVLTRRRLGETQQKFADRFGVQPLTVTKWESGDSEPRHEHTRELLNELFVEVLRLNAEAPIETAAYQLYLPFDEPVKIDFRVSPFSADRVRLGVYIARRAG